MVGALGELTAVGKTHRTVIKKKKKKKVRSLVRFTWEQMGGLLSPSTEGGDF